MSLLNAAYSMVRKIFGKVIYRKKGMNKTKKKMGIL